ncbi:uncharacterized protein LOC136067583 [Quercus suber]|uniref:uncharacterized protein LOC136067583 n=1 Tax=Quercus suber TaxID=58331 RepID=UPI0032DF6E4B
MVGQYCGGKEEEREVASVCGLHKSEQGLPKGSFPYAQDRLAGGCNRRSSSDELRRRLSGITPNTAYMEDQEKISFVTPTGNYHYKVMPFGLKNTGATYQKMMTRMFEPQLGKSIEIYIDDMVVKIKVVSEHLRDPGEFLKF